MTTEKNIWRKKGKDLSPEETVERIISLLKEAGFDTEYKDYGQELGCMYSSHVNLKPPYKSSFSANGKGMSPEFSGASAYAELMERLQNSIFAEKLSSLDPDAAEYLSLNGQPLYHTDSKEQPELIRDLFDRIAQSIQGLPPFMSKKMLITEMFNSISYQTCPGEFATRRYYSVKKGEMLSLPFELLHNFCLSNGMAAGNTLEEAIVQAICEIFERYSEYKFIEGKTVPPEISRDFIKKYENIYRIIENIEKTGRFKVFIRDCSLGLGLPVVCGIITDLSSQTFGIKFGAFPDMEIALERIFTEAMQGLSLEDFVKRNVPAFMDIKNARENSWNIIKVGIGAFPARLLNDEPDYPFKEWPDVTGKSNKELMHLMLDKLSEMGADTYISDVSYLGFPSVHVYAAGISEAITVDMKQLKEIKLAYEVQRIFRKGSGFESSDIRKILNYATIKRYSALENSFSVMSGIYSSGRAPGFPFEAEFLIMLCQYILGDHKSASKTIDSFAGFFKDRHDDDAIFIRTCQLFLDSVRYEKTANETAEILKKLSPEWAAEKVLDLFSDTDKLLQKAYDLCSDEGCAKCTNRSCEYTKVKKLYFRLRELEGKNKIPDEKIMELFRS